MSTILIRGGRVLDPSADFADLADVYIDQGRVEQIGQGLQRSAAVVIDAVGKLVCPGFVDMHVHLREPGGETDETIETGAMAALASGITTLACMPDTEPALDNQAAADFVVLQAKRAGKVNVHPIGAVTKGRNGQELAEMGGMTKGGAVAFTDDDRPIANAEIMRRALEYAQMFDRAVLSHPEDTSLGNHGLLHEGAVSASLGMAAAPAAAEEIIVDRDLKLAELTNGRLHLLNLSTAGSIESVRRAKSRGVRVTAEVNPQHFCLTDECLRSFDSVFKVKPPLRTQRDVEAVIAGLKDGTIDVISSGHSPRAPEQKMRELDAAPFGMIGIETLIPISIQALVAPGHLSWLELVRKLSTNPARVLGLDRGSLQVGKVADVTVFDPNHQWTINPQSFYSKSRNSPFVGWTVKGRAQVVIVNGQIRLQV